MEEGKLISVYEWITLINDDIKSLEEEKRFYIVNLLAIFPTVIYIFSLIFESGDKIIKYYFDNGIKMILFLWVMIIVLQLLIIALGIYISFYQDKILSLFNIFKARYQSIISIATNINFFILIMMKYLISLDILKSIFYYILVIIYGYYGPIGSIIIGRKIKGETIEDALKSGEEIRKEWIIKIIKIKNRILKIEYDEIKLDQASRFNETLIYSLVRKFNIAIQLMIMLSIIWLSYNLYQLYIFPYGLIKIITEFDLLIISLLFTYVFWFKPVMERLGIITEKIKKLSESKTNIIVNNLQSDGIRNKLSKIFDK